MNKKPNKKEDYESLKKIWYAKLEKEGFKDIEPHENTLKVWHSKLSSKYTAAEAEAKQIYYNMANHFLLDHQFETILDKVIWEYWAAGISVRDISDQLMRAKIQQVRKSYVWKTVRKHEKLMFSLYEADHNKYD